jgi:SPP1 gp7 family putative phage head morphogenesis protein
MLKLSEHSGCGCVDWDEAARAADALLLHVHRIELEKALDPLKPKDFTAIVAAVARDLSKVTGPIEKRHLAKAMQALDLDWNKATIPQMTAAVKAANLAVRQTSVLAAPAITRTLNPRVLRTGKATRRSAMRKYKLKITPRFDKQSQDVVKGIANIQSWVTDEYGRRGAMIALNAEQLIQDGLAKGLRSDEITKDIAAMGQRVGIAQSPVYWRLVSDNLLNRTRSFAHLGSIQDAGIDRFVFEAVMDERTTPECRMLHGKVFTVASGMGRLSQFSKQGRANPMLAETATPFVKRRRLANGELELYVQPPGAAKTVIGVNVSSAVGLKDTVGTYRNVASPAALEAAGVTVPPIHHGCRSTIVADV